MANVPVRRAGPGGTRQVTPPAGGGRAAPPQRQQGQQPNQQAGQQAGQQSAGDGGGADDELPFDLPAGGQQSGQQPHQRPKGGGAADLMAHRAREAGRSVAYELLGGYADLVMACIGTDPHTTAELLRGLADELDPPAPEPQPGGGG